jgi:Ca2+-binding RTX toxin-like protein
LNIWLDNVSNDGEFGEGDNVFTSNEVIIGGSGSDRLDASTVSYSVTLQGHGGGDTLVGGGGNDTISAVGATANATLVGNGGNDSLIGGGGDDSLQSDGGNDTLDGSYGADILDGGAGIDTVSYSTSAYAITVSLDGVANDGVGAITEDDNVIDVDVIIGSSLADTLSADGVDYAVTLIGNAGNDTLTGGGGNDSIYGGAGDDWLYAGGGVNLLSGDAGDDKFFSRNSNADALDGGAGTDYAYQWDDVLDEFSSIEVLVE